MAIYLYTARSVFDDSVLATSFDEQFTGMELQTSYVTSELVDVRDSATWSKLVSELMVKYDSSLFDKLVDMAYDRGHSAGYSECANILLDMCYHFRRELEKLKGFKY